MPHLCNLGLHIGLSTLAKHLTVKTLVILLPLEMVLNIAYSLDVCPILLLFLSLCKTCKILVAEKRKSEVCVLFDGHQLKVLFFDFEPILPMIILIVEGIKLLLISESHKMISHPLILEELPYREFFVGHFSKKTEVFSFNNDGYHCICRCSITQLMITDLHRKGSGYNHILRVVIIEIGWD